MDYDYKILEEKMLQLPKEIQQILSSVETIEIIKSIGSKRDLKLDQEEILYDLIAYIMLGLSPAKDFVRNFSREAGVDERVAAAVATDINTEVFAKIRSSMQAVEARIEAAGEGALGPDQARFNQARTDQAKIRGEIASVERAGGFSIERGENGNGNGGGNGIGYDDKEEILEGIEQPEPSLPRPNLGNEHTDIIVDHLLANPAATARQNIVHHTAEPPENLPEESGSSPAPKTEERASGQAPKPKGPDLYREPIK